MCGVASLNLRFLLCRVVAADVCGDVPAPHDKTLYPSDHAALKVTVEVERLLPHRRV